MIYRQPSPFANLPFVVSTIRGKYFVSRFAVRDIFPRLFAVFVTSYVSLMENFAFFIFCMHYYHENLHKFTNIIHYMGRSNIM